MENFDKKYFTKNPLKIEIIILKKEAEKCLISHPTTKKLRMKK